MGVVCLRYSNTLVNIHVYFHLGTELQYISCSYMIVYSDLNCIIMCILPDSNLNVYA